MKKILFRYPNDNEGFIRLGEFGFICRACYYRGKELGYNNIYIEWPNNIEYTRNHYLRRNNRTTYGEPLELECPDDTILPINFISNDDIKESDYDKVMNMNENDAFYNGSEPIFLEIDGKILRSNLAPHEFLNKYYITYNEHPIFDIKKDKLKYKYILIHTRNALNSKSRNPKIKTYLHILKLLKENFSDYKIFRCGETYSWEVENEINEYIDDFYRPTDDFDLFLRLINNSSLYVGCTSGPIEYAKSFNLPVVELDIPLLVWDSKSTGVYASDKYSYYSKEYWKNVFHGRYGDAIEDNLNQDKILKLYKNKKLNDNVILEFIERWIWK